MIAFGAETDTVAILVIMAFLGGALTKVLGSDTVEREVGNEHKRNYRRQED